MDLLIVSLVAVIEEPSSNQILVVLLIIITSVLAISLVFLFMMLCKYPRHTFETSKSSTLLFFCR